MCISLYQLHASKSVIFMYTRTTNGPHNLFSSKWNLIKHSNPVVTKKNSFRLSKLIKILLRLKFIKFKEDRNRHTETQTQRVAFLKQILISGTFSLQFRTLVLNVYITFQWASYVYKKLKIVFLVLHTLLFHLTPLILHFHSLKHAHTKRTLLVANSICHLKVLHITLEPMN